MDPMGYKELDHSEGKSHGKSISLNPNEIFGVDD